MDNLVDFDKISKINEADWIGSMVVKVSTSAQLLSALDDFLALSGDTKHVFFVGESNRRSGAWKIFDGDQKSCVEFSDILSVFEAKKEHCKSLIVFSETSHSHLMKRLADETARLTDSEQRVDVVSATSMRHPTLDISHSVILAHLAEACVFGEEAQEQFSQTYAEFNKN